MAGNTAPIWTKVGDVQWASTAGAANTATDGTGTVSVVFTADVTNGGRCEKIISAHLGTNVASVIRYFINNGATNTTASNNALFAEVTAAANTLSQVAAQVLAGLTIIAAALPPGYRILATNGTLVAAGYAHSVWGGKY